MVKHIYKCDKCGFEADVRTTPVSSDGYRGFCPKCNAVLQFDRYESGLINNNIMNQKHTYDDVDKLGAYISGFLTGMLLTMVVVYFSNGV